MSNASGLTAEHFLFFYTKWAFVLNFYKMKRFVRREKKHTTNMLYTWVDLRKILGRRKQVGFPNQHETKASIVIYKYKSR